MTTKRKLLFVLFSDDDCRINHALMYALDLHGQGHTVQIIVEGVATRLFERIADSSLKLSKLFQKAKELNLIAGACLAASSGCANEKGEVKLCDLAKAQGVTLKSEMDNHAGITKQINEGFELAVF